MMDKNKVYSSRDVDNTVSELADMILTTDFTANQYRDLCQAIKDSPYFYSDDFIDYDYVDVAHDNVYAYLDGMTESEIFNLLIEYGFEDGSVPKFLFGLELISIEKTKPFIISL